MRTDEMFENLVKDAGKYCRSDTNHTFRLGLDFVLSLCFNYDSSMSS